MQDSSFSSQCSTCILATWLQKGLSWEVLTTGERRCGVLFIPFSPHPPWVPSPFMLISLGTSCPLLLLLLETRKLVVASCAC